MRLALAAPIIAAFADRTPTFAMDRNATPSRTAARTAHITPFYVMELMKHAHQLELQGRSIIHMSVGEPDFTAPPRVIAALADAMARGDTHYTSAVGIRPLRQAIADFLKARHGVDIDCDRVDRHGRCVGRALLLTMAAIVDPGQEILMPDPSYPCNRHFVAAFDGVAKLIPSGPEDRFQLSAKMVEDHWSPNTRGVLVASPSNPTGTSIAPDELQPHPRGRRGAQRHRDRRRDLSRTVVSGRARHRASLRARDSATT